MTNKEIDQLTKAIKLKIKKENLIKEADKDGDYWDTIKFKNTEYDFNLYDGDTYGKEWYLSIYNLKTNESNNSLSIDTNNPVAEGIKLSELSWKDWLKKLRKNAEEYYAQSNICPDGIDILDFVCEKVENVSGCDVDVQQSKSIAKILGITEKVAEV